MRRLVIGLTAFVLGGTTAGALSMVGAAHPPKASAQPATKVILPAGRLPVSAASMREALSKGLIDRPVRSILAVPGRMTYGDYRWDEKGVPAGPTWIRVDLKSQILSVFRGGHEIGTAVILYGADGVPTPTGRFPVLAKFRDHRSSTYEAPMPFTLRLTKDGVSIHASKVRWGYATHGCIGVPEPFAARLFEAVHIGDQVMIIDRGPPPRSA